MQKPHKFLLLFFLILLSVKDIKNVFFILSDPLHELTYCGSGDGHVAEPQCSFCVVDRPDSGATSCWKDGLTDSASGDNLQLFQWPYRLCLLSSALESPGYWLERFISLSSILIFFFCSSSLFPVIYTILIQEDLTQMNFSPTHRRVNRKPELPSYNQCRVSGKYSF